jgi:hypothetical protein
MKWWFIVKLLLLCLVPASALLLGLFVAEFYLPEAVGEQNIVMLSALVIAMVALALMVLSLLKARTASWYHSAYWAFLPGALLLLFVAFAFYFSVYV